jgi:hypothetical protein
MMPTGVGRLAHWSMQMRRLIIALSLILAFSMQSDAAPFSVRCERDGYYFLTFDDETGRFVSESPARVDGDNRAYKGRISHINDNEIRFVLLMQGAPPGNMIFHRKEGTVDALKADGPSNSLVNCVPTALRAILSKYDLISPLD